MRVRCSYCRHEIAVLADGWVQWFGITVEVGRPIPEVRIELVHGAGRGCTLAERAVTLPGYVSQGEPASATLAGHRFEDRRTAPTVLHRLHALRWQQPAPTCADCGSGRLPQFGRRIERGGDGRWRCARCHDRYVQPLDEAEDRRWRTRQAVSVVRGGRA